MATPRIIRPRGISGSAGLLALAGLYLVYAGVRDVPLIDGLRQIASGRSPSNLERPHERAREGRDLDTGEEIPTSGIQGASGDAGIERLVGNARAGYLQLKRKFPGIRVGGWRATGSVANSDHPLGKALDLFTTDNGTAQAIISFFKTQQGAKYWIWDRKIGHYQSLWVPRNYTGPSPHTDHVHLSYY